MRAVSILLVCVGFYVGATPAKADLVADVLGCNDDPCVISYSPGGVLNQFENAANAIRHGARTLVVVDGACKSACTVLIDRIPDKVCLTDRARLYFHQGTEYVLKWMSFPQGGATVETPFIAYSEERRFTPLYSQTVVEWLHRIGGLPDDGTFVEMPPALAKKIWLPCEIQAHGLY